MFEVPTTEAIKSSTQFAFDTGKPKDPELHQKIKTQEEVARGLKEKLLGKVRDVAHEARGMGLDLGGAASATQRWAASEIWKTAQMRVERRLKGMALNNPDLVIRTLGEIDPMDVQIENLSSEPGKPRQRAVRRSVGVTPGTKAHFHEANINAKFLDNPQDPTQLILGGQSFRKEAIQRSLSGEGQYKPMWHNDGVYIPLISIQTGELHFVNLTVDQLKQFPPHQEMQTTPPSEQTFDHGEIKYGSYGISSPDHIRQDDYGNTSIYNEKSELFGVRFYSIDGSGGALDGTNVPESERPQKVVDKVASIKSFLQSASRLRGVDALIHADREARADTANPAFAGAVVVDVYKSQVEIARMGDHSVVLWCPQGFDHRRGEAWGSNSGDPSPFQSVDRPQNVAYTLKAAGDARLTERIEYQKESNYILSAVGLGKPNVEKTSIPRTDEVQYLLILSDGARGSGMLLEPNEQYSQRVNQLMQDLHAGSITENTTARMIANEAARVFDERDDISVQLVKLPPKKE